jgi:riboflavin kinase/FMN adenylyltransferase
MVCSVIALGFFDGVHLGHGALLRRTAELAAEKGCRALALTFDRSPGKDGRLLSSVEDRTRLIRGLYGIDEVVVLPFTDELRHMAWETFLENLARDHGALHLVCGWDYRFGYLGAGDSDKLRAWCALRGLGCDVVDKLVVDGITVSSTILKDMVEAGDVEAACRYYGHPHVLTGTVLPGQHLGSRLGFPTANLEPAPELVLPRDGVYAVTGTAGGRTYTGVCNVGTRPTVGGGRRTVETWLDDFDGDLYGKELRVAFYRYLRQERTFPDLESLKREILRNRQQARDFFSDMELPSPWGQIDDRTD